MYYPPDWPANDASATGRKIHDVTMTPKHIDPSCGIRSTFLFEQGASRVKKKGTISRQGKWKHRGK